MTADKVILGEGAIYSTDCEVTGINNNVLVIGGSGSGKTMSIAEPRLLETLNSSIIVTVTKRRIVNQYKQFFKDKGYLVQDLNFISPKESDIGYDPLRYVSSYKDITFLAESIVMADPKKKRASNDPYWDKTAISLLSALIAYVMMKDKKASFADVLDLTDSLTIQDGSNHIQTSLDEKFDRLAAREPNCFAVSCWRSFSQLGRFVKPLAIHSLWTPYLVWLLLKFAFMLLEFIFGAVTAINSILYVIVIKEIFPLFRKKHIVQIDD